MERKPDWLSGFLVQIVKGEGSEVLIQNRQQLGQLSAG